MDPDSEKPEPWKTWILENMEYICNWKICLTLESYVLTKSMFLLIKFSVPTILSEQICLELKVWMWSFLNIRNSCPEVSSKKGALKTKILPNSSKKIWDSL